MHRCAVCCCTMQMRMPEEVHQILTPFSILKSSWLPVEYELDENFVTDNRFGQPLILSIPALECKTTFTTLYVHLNYHHFHFRTLLSWANAAKKKLLPEFMLLYVTTKKQWCPHARSFCSSIQTDQREQSYVKANLMHQNKQTYEKKCSSHQKIQLYTTLAITTVCIHSPLVILAAHCTYFANCSCSCLQQIKYSCGPALWAPGQHPAVHAMMLLCLFFYTLWVVKSYSKLTKKKRGEGGGTKKRANQELRSLRPAKTQPQLCCYRYDARVLNCTYRRHRAANR